MSESNSLFRVTFINQNKVYEVYAKSVGESGLFGFVEIGELTFSAKKGVVVDPTEEALKQEFDDVDRFYIPMQSVIRIDEVKEQGTAKIKDLPEHMGNVSQFPTPMLQEKN